MLRTVDLVRKECLIRNLERSQNITVNYNDIENIIAMCPRGTNIYDPRNEIEINKNCFISDLHRNVPTFNANYGEIGNSIRNCKLYKNRIEGFGKVINDQSLPFILFLFSMLLFLSSL